MFDYFWEQFPLVCDTDTDKKCDNKFKICITIMENFILQILKGKLTKKWKLFKVYQTTDNFKFTNIIEIE